jgi:hypothetical protein
VRLAGGEGDWCEKIPPLTFCSVFREDEIWECPSPVSVEFVGNIDGIRNLPLEGEGDVGCKLPML